MYKPLFVLSKFGSKRRYMLRYSNEFELTGL
jgi:hypothetical protein